MERSSFFAFIFSFVPGAGQMYLGLMKKGSIILTLFCGLGFLSAFMQVDLLLLFLPVIWFYSFFDTLNLKRLSYDQRLENENEFLKLLSRIFGRLVSEDFKNILGKRHLLVGSICIFFGLYIIFYTITDKFVLKILFADFEYFYEIQSLINSIPTVAVAVIIILFGLKLVKSNVYGYDEKKEKSEEDFEFIEFKGDEDKKE